MRLTWLEDVLRRALEPRGHKVQTVSGWQSRGRALSARIRWLIDHHTASSQRSGASGSLRICIYGRAGLPGPLCHVHGSRDGVTTIVAAGRANHAGYGRCPDGSDPNSTGVGREDENDGVGEPWPARQREVTVIGDAAILTHLGQPAAHALGHREVDPRRKIDPTYDMDDHRRRVDAAQHGTPPKPPPKETFLMALNSDQQSTLYNAVIGDVRPALKRIEAALANLPSKASVLRDPRDQKAWVIDGDSRWHVPSRQVLDVLIFIGQVGAPGGDIPMADPAWLDGIPEVVTPEAIAALV